MSGNYAANRLRQSNREFGTPSTGFKIMRAFVIAFIAVVFATMAVMLTMYLTGNLNMSYSYNYEVGNVKYSETYESN